MPEHSLDGVPLGSNNYVMYTVCSITGHLGSGYFGQVQQGVWIDGEEAIDVAMKTLNKQDVKRADKVKFLQEAAIMAQFRHPNIVTLYGISYKQEPVSRSQQII